jgi:hypothetical protein
MVRIDLYKVVSRVATEGVPSENQDSDSNYDQANMEVKDM